MTPGDGLDWHCFGCLHWNSLGCTEILVAWGDPKPGYKQNLILPRGKVFSMDHILTLGLPSSCCSLGAHPLMTIYTRGLCITLYSKGHLHPNQTISATLPGLGPTLKHPQWLFCLFCAALSGTRLITWSLLGSSLWGRLMQRNTK